MRQVTLAHLAVLCITILGGTAKGQSPNAFIPASGSANWSTGSNWSSGAYPNAADAVAVFNELNGPLTIEPVLSIQNPVLVLTMGELYVAPSSGAGTITFYSSNSNSANFSFQTTSGPAQMLVARSSGTPSTTAGTFNFINVGITLASDLVIDDRNLSSYLNPDITIGGLSGGSSRKIFKTGVGFALFNGSVSAYSGGLVVEGGGVGLSSNTLTSAGNVSILPGGQFEISINNNDASFNFATSSVLTLGGTGRSGSRGSDGALRIDNSNPTSAVPWTATFANAVGIQSSATVYVDILRILNITGIVSSGNGVGLTVNGAGTLKLSNANSLSGSITVNGGTLAASARGTGNALGGSPTIYLNNGKLQVIPITGTSSPTNTVAGDLTINGGTTVNINWSSTAGNTTLTSGSLTRQGTSTVVFDSGAGTLNSNSIFSFSAAPSLTNGILPYAAALQPSSQVADLVTIVTGNRLAIASYANQSVTSINTYPATGGTAIVNIDLNAATTSSRSVAALRITGTSFSGATLTNTGNTLTVGSGAGPSTVLLSTYGTIVGGNLSLRGEGIVYSGGSNSISSVIQGTGGLTIYGTGITLSGVNTYSGTTTINSGNVTITSDSNLGAVPASATPSSLVINNGSLTINSTGTIDPRRGITVGSSTSSIIAGQGSVVQYNGIIAGQGSLIVGASNGFTSGGTLTLGGSSTYSGDTVINAGTLSLGANNALPASTGLVVVQTFDLAGFNQTVTSIKLGYSPVITNSNIFSASTLTINNSETTGETPFQTGLLTSVYSGGLPQSTLNLTKMGQGLLTLTRSNTYSGTTTVNGGILAANSGDSFGYSANPLVIGNAMVELNSNSIGDNYTLSAGPLTISGGATVTLVPTAANIVFNPSSLSITGSGSLVLNPTVGPLNLTNGNPGSTFQFSLAPTTTNGIISPAVVLQKRNSTDGDFVALDSSNRAIPVVYTNQSTTSLNSYPALNGSAVHNVDVSATTTGSRSVYALRISSVVLTNSGNTLSVGNGAGQAGVILNGGSISGGVLTFGTARGVVYTNSSGGLISSQVLAAGGFTSFGPGTLSLTGIASTGTTTATVNGGVLRIDGTLTGSVLAANGIVGGSGQIQGSVTAQPSGGVAPGNPSLLTAGVLSVAGPVTFLSGSSLTAQANGNTPGSGSSNYSQLVVTSGSVSIGQGTDLYVNLGLGYTPAPTDRLFIIRNQTGSTINGAFAGLSQDSSFFVGSTPAYISYTGNYTLGSLVGGNDAVVYFATPVPEPENIMLLSLVICLMPAICRKFF